MTNAKKLGSINDNLTKFKDPYVNSFGSFKNQLATLGAAIVTHDFGDASFQHKAQNTVTNEDSNRILTLEEAIINFKEDLNDIKQSLRLEGNDIEFEKLNDQVCERPYMW